jgi:hypothetical protein
VLVVDLPPVEEYVEVLTGAGCRGGAQYLL